MVNKQIIGALAVFAFLTGCGQQVAPNVIVPSPMASPVIVKPTPSPVPLEPEVLDKVEQLRYQELLNDVEPTPAPKSETSVKKTDTEMYAEKGVTVVGVPSVQTIGIGTYMETEVKPQEVVRPTVTEEDLYVASMSEVSSNIDDIVKDNYGLGKFVITAYDLSFQSTEKVKGDKDYGITASGMSLVGLTWETARVVAVDPNVIPLGKKVYIKFSGEYSKYDGVYKAKDVGGAIKGRHLDFFMGDFDSYYPDPSVKQFGKVFADVFAIN